MSDSSTDAVIVAVARTPFGRFDGQLKNIPGPQLGAYAIDEVVRRSSLSPERVDSLYAGVGMISSGRLTPARQALLQSCLPQDMPSLAVDRACCSGMSAIGLGFKDILSEQAQAVVCGGFDNLSATPFLWPRQRGVRPGDVSAEDPLTLRSPISDKAIAAYTGDEAVQHGVDRAQQDSWALDSHRRYFEAEKNGYFEFERFGVEVPQRKDIPIKVDADESPRRDTTLERLSQLETVYGSPTITPGNAPGLNDGSAFVMITNAATAQEFELTVLARLTAYTQVADAPTSGSYTPAIGITRLLKSKAIEPEDLDLIEINEAYAATPLVSTLRLAQGDLTRAENLRQKTNIHGGAVAIGHPLGASGARLTMTLINGLRERGGGRGAAAICGGFGQGDALLLEVND